MSPGSPRWSRCRRKDGRRRRCRKRCTTAKVRAALKFSFKLFRTVMYNMKDAQGSEELMGVVKGGVVHSKCEKESVVQAFQLSSEVWVRHTIHKWNGAKTERAM